MATVFDHAETRPPSPRFAARKYATASGGSTACHDDDGRAGARVSTVIHVMPSVDHWTRIAVAVTERFWQVKVSRSST